MINQLEDTYKVDYSSYDLKPTEPNKSIIYSADADDADDADDELSPNFIPVISNPILIPEYIYIRDINSGAFGSIKLYEGPLGRVAVKFMSKLKVSRRLFQSEVRILEKLRLLPGFCSEALLRYYDFGEVGGYYYIITEYVSGTPLNKIIDNFWYGYDSNDIVIYMKEIAKSIKCLHDQGIVHHDIKPENIMILKGGKIKLLDFGLSCLQSYGDFDQDLKCTNTVSGTPFFVPKEVFDQTVKPGQFDKIDIFSLGVLFFYMTTGYRLFEGDNLRELIDNINSDTHTGIVTGDRKLDILIKFMITQNPWLRPSIIMVLTLLDRLNNSKFLVF